jgi:hypothetical protein
MMVKYKVLIISGFIASGKSTVARYLERYLNSRGFKVSYVYISSYHFLVYYLSYFILRMKFPRNFVKEIMKTGVHPVDVVSYVWSKMISLLISLEIFTLFIIYLIRVIIPLKLRIKNIIIIDEGPIHTLTAYIELTNNMKCYLGEDIVKYSRILISMFFRIISYLLRNTQVSIYYLRYDSLNELINRASMRGWPRPLQGVLSYRDIMNHNKMFDYSEDIIKKVLNVRVTMYNVSKERPTVVLRHILNDIAN